MTDNRQERENGIKNETVENNLQRTETIKVLVVEDNTVYSDLLLKMMSSEKEPIFKFSTVNCLTDAIQNLYQNKVDIILLDLNLPDSAGLETFTVLHEKHSDVPIVVLSGVDDDRVALDAVRTGAQDYLIKGDVDRNNLVRTIRYSIERHRMICKLESVTNELISANKKLKTLVLQDPLTGLLNRRGIQQALSREIHWAWRDKSSLLALLLNLDDFNRVNKRIGHASGDVILKEVAIKIKSSVRATDYISRIGGDEFLVLLPKTDLEEGSRIAERLRICISSMPVSLPSGDEMKITASIGILSVKADSPSVDELLEQIHSAVFESKKNGKNRITYQQDQTGAKVTIGHDVTAEELVYHVLRSGDHFRAVKQPIVSLADDRHIGYEFLSRLNFNGFENPDVFFRVCLEANILTMVDHQCMKTCIRSAGLLPPDLRRHLNLFPSTMIDIPIEHLLDAFRLDPQKGIYCIEISEQQIIGHPVYLLNAVDTLKRNGILIAIDDVGFGRTCLENLVLFEPQIIKIDKKCVDGLSDHPDRVRQMKQLLKIANALDAEVVAEGIERESDLQVLKDLKVPYGQGYLLGRPA